MNQRIAHSIKYLNYLIYSRHKNGHGIHSPFAYNFIRNYLRYSRKHPSKAIKGLIHKYRKDKKKICYQTQGEASHYRTRKTETVSKIALKQGIRYKDAQLLHRVIRKNRPECIVEIGTSIGVSALAMALADIKCMVHTFEGSPEKLSVAKAYAQTYGLRNIKFHQGNFDTTLTETLPELPVINLAFIDGNHALKPTLNYFRQIQKKCNADSVIILDDIHWSEEMAQAWETIKSMPAVTMTLDLFRFGIVFFRPGLNNQHFVIRY